MAANTFGKIFQMHTFGESHGAALGVVVDGCPAGLDFDFELLQINLDRRKPGQSGLQAEAVTSRQESDLVEVLSGVFEGKTLGTPIAMMVRNQDARSKDYDAIKAAPRAGHADDVWKSKFGHSDPRGGGRSSGRETVARVMAGSVAQMLCQAIVPDLKVTAYVSSVGPFSLSEVDRNNLAQIRVDEFVARFPSASQTLQLQKALREAKEAGESFGGTVSLKIENVPPNLGQPVFNKLKSDLAGATLSIGAFVSFDLGGLSSEVQNKGTEFHASQQSYGGIRGGISTGQLISFDAAIKPTSSILDVAKKGRHDPFIGTRAVPVLEAMVWMVLADHLLWSRVDKI